MLRLLVKDEEVEDRREGRAEVKDEDEDEERDDSDEGDKEDNDDNEEDRERWEDPVRLRCAVAS